jgi:hypothetical protein
MVIGKKVLSQTTLIAYFHQQALNRATKSLTTLKILKDPLYEKRKWREHFSQEIRLHLASRHDECMKNKLIEQLESEQTALDRINEQSNSISSSTQASILSTTMRSLFSGEIPRFKLFLKRSENFYIEFIYHYKHLQINLPNIDKLTATRIFNEDHLKK